MFIVSITNSTFFVRTRQLDSTNIVTMTKRTQSPKIAVPGLRIHEARKAQKISQEKLGISIGLDETTSSARISRYESGTHEPPLPTAKRIALKLNVPLAYLYCDNDQIAKLILELANLGSDDLDRVSKYITKLPK